MELLPFELQDGPPIAGEMRMPARGRGLLPILLLPDFLLFRGWGFYPFLAERLAERFCVITFDASRSGFRAGNQFKADLFHEYSLSSELEDVRRILAHLYSHKLPGADRVKTEGDQRLGLCGHTKGAALALILATELPEAAAVACLSSICTINRLSDGDRDRLLRDGSLDLREPVAGSTVSMGRAFLDDLRQNPERFALERIVRGFTRPLLFVHGEEDGAASIEEAETLYHWSNKDRSRLVVLEKTGHTFGARHPFDGPNDDVEKVAHVVRSFFEGSMLGTPTSSS
jgi:pimeloyl-ACP methyl ester carboxylesterase